MTSHLFSLFIFAYSKALNAQRKIVCQVPPRARLKTVIFCKIASAFIPFCLVLTLVASSSITCSLPLSLHKPSYTKQSKAKQSKVK